MPGAHLLEVRLLLLVEHRGRDLLVRPGLRFPQLPWLIWINRPCRLRLLWRFHLLPLGLRAHIYGAACMHVHNHESDVWRDRTTIALLFCLAQQDDPYHGKAVDSVCYAAASERRAPFCSWNLSSSPTTPAPCGAVAYP